MDNLVNLRKLSLSVIIDETFNFELFKNLSNQLEDILIRFFNADEKTFFRLFDGCNFPYLEVFTIEYIEIKRLKKEYLNGFSTLRQLNITSCEIEVIEHDSFSNMQQLSVLDLSRNRIGSIEKNAFSKLENLQTLKLRNIRLTNFDREFIGLRNSVQIDIYIDSSISSLFD